MTKQQCASFLICIGLFSFLGGLAGQLLIESVSFAENQDRKQNEFINAGMIRSKQIKTNSIHLINQDDQIVATLEANKKGNPLLQFYNSDNPRHQITQKHKEFMELLNINATKALRKASNSNKMNAPSIMLTSNPHPSIVLSDVDRDPRIMLSVDNIDPTMRFFYRNKNRLILGTNKLYTKTTGEHEKIEGSVVAYDSQERAVDIFPGAYD